MPSAGWSFALVVVLGLGSYAGGARAEEEAPAGAPDAGVLAEELASPDLERRRKAVYALWNLGKESRPAIPALARALRDDDEYVRTTADKVLATFGMTKAPGALEVAVPQLAEALSDERVEVRRLAAGALWRMGWLSQPPPHPSLSPALVRALDDLDPLVRALAAAVVANIATAVPDTIPALRRRATDVDKDVRAGVLRALAAGPGHSDALDLFIAATKDPEPTVREAAAAGLGVWGPKARAAVPALTAALDDGDARVRQAAVGAFFELSGAAPAPEAVPKLLPFLGMPEPAVRMAAAAALGAIGDPRALEPLVQRASDDVDASVRAQAADALGAMGPEGVEGADTLVTALGDTDALVVASAVRALGLLAPLAPEAEPALRRMLRHPDPRVRGATALALSGFPAPSATTRAALLSALDDSERFVRSPVLQWVTRQGSSASDALPALRGLLERDETQREEVLVALGALGPSAKDALPAIRAVDGSELLRIARAYALARISEAPEEVEREVRVLAQILARAPEITFSMESSRATLRLADLGKAARPARGELALRFLLGRGLEWIAAAQALVAIDGAQAFAAVERLRAAAREGQPMALDAMTRVLADDPETKALLLAAAKSENAMVRWRAVESLGKVSPVADDVVTALRTARGDHNGRVRLAAAVGLRAHEGR